MSRLHSKDWVCLLSKTALEAKYAAHRERAQRSGRLPGSLPERLWRQIELIATTDGISLSLMNVDAEAAGGGCWSGGEAYVSRRFTWEDLHDVDFVDQMLEREQCAVARRVQAMLLALRSRSQPLRESLAAL